MPRDAPPPSLTPSLTHARATFMLMEGATRGERHVVQGVLLAQAAGLPAPTAAQVAAIVGMTERGTRRLLRQQVGILLGAVEGGGHGRPDRFYLRTLASTTESAECDLRTQPSTTESADYSPNGPADSVTHDSVRRNAAGTGNQPPPAPPRRSSSSEPLSISSSSSSSVPHGSLNPPRAHEGEQAGGDRPGGDAPAALAAAAADINTSEKMGLGEGLARPLDETDTVFVEETATRFGRLPSEGEWKRLRKLRSAVSVLPGQVRRVFREVAARSEETPKSASYFLPRLQELAEAEAVAANGAPSRPTPAPPPPPQVESEAERLAKREEARRRTLAIRGGQA